MKGEEGDEVTPLLEASTQWKKSLSKMEKPQLSICFNRHTILTIVGISISFLLLTAIHQYAGTQYESAYGNDSYGDKYPKSRPSSASFTSLSEDGDGKVYCDENGNGARMSYPYAHPFNHCFVFSLANLLLQSCYSPTRLNLPCCSYFTCLLAYSSHLSYSPPLAYLLHNHTY